jgi:hypothetical protein
VVSPAKVPLIYALAFHRMGQPRANLHPPTVPTLQSQQNSQLTPAPHQVAVYASVSREGLALIKVLSEAFLKSVAGVQGFGDMSHC